MNKMTNRILVLIAALFGTSVSAGAGPVYRYVACTACAARIPDHSGTTDGIANAGIAVPSYVCSGTTVQAYALQLDITHSNVGDLRVKLTSPANTSVVVVNRPVASGNCAGDDISATFSDAGSAVACGTTIPALSGDLQSSAGMASLGSTPQPGAWQVEVRDQAHGGDGFLSNAQLRVACGYTGDIFNDNFEMP